MYWCLCSGGDLLLFMCLYGVCTGVYVVMYWCLHGCVVDVLVFMLWCAGVYDWWWHAGVYDCGGDVLVFTLWWWCAGVYDWGGDVVVLVFMLWWWHFDVYVVVMCWWLHCDHDVLAFMAWCWCALFLLWWWCGVYVVVICWCWCASVYVVVVMSWYLMFASPAPGRALFCSEAGGVVRKSSVTPETPRLATHGRQMWTWKDWLHFVERGGELEDYCGIKHSPSDLEVFLLVVRLLHGSASGFFMEVGQVTLWKWVRFLHGSGSGYFMEVKHISHCHLIL